MDTLDQDLIETGLDALRRMSQGLEMTKTAPLFCIAG